MVQGPLEAETGPVADPANAAGGPLILRRVLAPMRMSLEDRAAWSAVRTWSDSQRIECHDTHPQGVDTAELTAPTSPPHQPNPSRPAGTADILIQLLGANASAVAAEIRGQGVRLWRASGAATEGLLNWRQLDDVLTTAGRDADLIKLCREGRTLDARAYVRGGTRLDATEVARALRAGHSIILEYVERYHAPVRELIAALSRAVGEIAWTAAFVSWTSQRCLPTHFDNHDVLIVQTEGEKEWTVLKPTREAPQRLDTAAEAAPARAEVAWQGVLRRGDVLYIPRGWWHHARSTGQGSIHLGCAFVGRAGVDVLDHMLDLACEQEDLRADLPRVGRSAGLPLARFLTVAAGDASLDTFWRRHAGHFPARPAANLPFVLDPATLLGPGVRLALAGAAAIDDTEPDVLALELDARRWRCAPSVRPILEQLVQVSGASADELVTATGASLPARDLIALLGEFVRDGLLVAETAPAAAELPADERHD